MQDAAASIVEPLTSFSIGIPRGNVPVFRVRGCRPNLRVRDALNLGSCFGDFNVMGGLSRTICGMARGRRQGETGSPLTPRDGRP